MSNPADPLPADPAELAALVRRLQARNADLLAQVATLRALVFGVRSERAAVLAPGQGLLDLGAPPAPAPPGEDASERGSRTGCGPRRPARRNVGALPPHLPRIERTVEPASTACPDCASPMRRIGEDVAEALDVVPAVVRVLRTVRPKYACPCCAGRIVQAAAPARVVDGGMASTALVAHVAVAKFAWHLPLYRQAQMLAGQGIALDRTTLVHWVRRAAWWLEPLHARLLAYIRSQERVFCDETPLPRLDPGRGRTKICQMWAQAVDDRPWRGPAMPAVGYVFAEARDTAAVQEQLATFGGILQVDGYAAYKALARRRDGEPIRLVFCLAHARRKFVAVLRSTGSEVAQDVIARIATVYAIEDRIRGAPADVRARVRQHETRPVMEGLKARLTAVRAEISGQSSLAGAIDYTLGHWSGLTAFLDDGRIEVDTNTVERTMRPIGIARSFCPCRAGRRRPLPMAPPVRSDAAGRVGRATGDRGDPAPRRGARRRVGGARLDGGPGHLRGDAPRRAAGLARGAP